MGHIWPKRYFPTTPQVLIIQKTHERACILIYIETVIFCCTELDGKLDHIQAICLQRGWQVLFESFRANHVIYKQITQNYTWILIIVQLLKKVKIWWDYLAMKLEKQIRHFTTFTNSSFTNREETAHPSAFWRVSKETSKISLE